MLSKAFGSLLALAMLPAVAQVQSSVQSGPASPATPSAVIPRQHEPRRVYPRPARVIDNVTVSDSTNWSGYAVTGTAFTSAKASWVVPTATCSKTPNTYSSFWVGL